MFVIINAMWSDYVHPPFIDDLITKHIILSLELGYGEQTTETTLSFIITSSILILSVLNKRRKRF